MGKSEMGSPPPAQLLDPGLSGLSLVAGYYRIAGDPMQLRHQLALTGRRAQAEDIVRGANVLQLKSRILRGVTAKRLGAIPFPADPKSKGWWFRRPGRRFDQRNGEAGRSNRPDSARVVDGGRSGA